MYVIEASYILKKFDIINILGKGRDFTLNIVSQIYLVKRKPGKNENKPFFQGNYALQVFEGLSPEVYNIKVTQLQNAMLNHLTYITTRIALLGKTTHNASKYDLYVLYELHMIEEGFKTLSYEEALNEEKAKALIELFAKNLMLTGRYTNEFLDISPQNIYLNNQGVYNISNFGISYAGSKFHRIFIPSTDLFHKQKTPQNIIHSYSFMAGLVTFLSMTKIDSKELFFQDGQFKANLFRQLIDYMLLDEAQQKKKKPPLEQFQDLTKHKYSKEFLDRLKELISIPTAPRAALLNLITLPMNHLGTDLPFIENQTYQGEINIEGKETTFNGNGFLSYGQGQFSAGLFANNQPTDMYSTNKINDYYLQNGLKSRFKQLIDPNVGLIMCTELDEDNMAKGSCYLFPFNEDYLPNKQVILYIKGTCEHKQITQGKAYLKDKSVYIGKFKNNQPFDVEGQIQYLSQEKTFIGEVQGFNRIKGKLMTKDWTFVGDFEKNEMKKGELNYSNGAVYQGSFKNGERHGLGSYCYPKSYLSYTGEFKDNRMHGKGDLSILNEDFTVEVKYDMGRCLTDENSFPEPILNILKQIKKQREKQQQGEEIPEEIDENAADQNEDEWEDQCEVNEDDQQEQQE